MDLAYPSGRPLKILRKVFDLPFWYVKITLPLFIQDDLHWFETVGDSPGRKPTYVVPSKLREESSSNRAVVEPKGPMTSTKGKVVSDGSKPINSPDLNEVEEEQRVLNNNALLKQYLYPDSLNNVVLNENKETASYHVVPGGEDKANWQKGAESLVQLDKNKANNSKEKETSGDVSTEPIIGDEDDRKQAGRFQSLVIQDDDMLTKEEGDDKEAISSEGNGGDDLGEADENKQAAAIQSMMKQEDDIIQHENDDENEESSGNNSTVDTTLSRNNLTANGSNDYKTNHSLPSSEKLRRKPKAYYSSGVAINNNPKVSESGVAKANTALNSTGISLNDSLHNHATSNPSSVDSSTPIGRPSNETNKHEDAGPTEKALFSQDNKTGGQLVSNPSSSQIVENKGKNDQTSLKQPETKLKGSSVETDLTNASVVSANNGGQSVELVLKPYVPPAQSGNQMRSKPEIGNRVVQENLQSRVPQMTKIGNTANQDKQTWDVSNNQSPTVQSQQSSSFTANPTPMPSVSGSLKNQDSSLTPISLSQTDVPAGQVNVMTSTDSNGNEGSLSVSNIHHVTSPAVITLPNSSSRPIKLVFHVQDMKPKEISADVSQPSSEAQQSALFANDVTQHTNNGGKL